MNEGEMEIAGDNDPETPPSGRVKRDKREMLEPDAARRPRSRVDNRIIASATASASCRGGSND
jgi:hypothetical protein